MRIFVFAASVILVLASLCFYLISAEEPAFLAPQPRHRARSWCGYLRTFLTGELLYDAWYGPLPAAEAGTGGGAGAPEATHGAAETRAPEDAAHED